MKKYFKFTKKHILLISLLISLLILFIICIIYFINDNEKKKTINILGNGRSLKNFDFNIFVIS